MGENHIVGPWYKWSNEIKYVEVLEPDKDFLCHIFVVKDNKFHSWGIRETPHKDWYFRMVGDRETDAYNVRYYYTWMKMIKYAMD